MKRKPTPSLAPPPLRRRAETRLRQRAGKNKSGAGVIRSTADTQRLLHELQVHQIELEMQNEELRLARDKIEAGLAQYSDLYEFAPIGYLTLDPEGTILEANLAAASLLVLPRSQLVKQRLSIFMAPADRPPFDAFLQRVFASKDQQEHETKLLRKEQPVAEVRLRANLVGSGLACRVTFSDITLQKQAEADRLVIQKLESTGILAGGIAHDFNNLLTVILLSLELARLYTLPGSPLADRLEAAKKAALLAHGLTEQLITFADGGMPIRQTTRLPGVVRESIRLVPDRTARPH